MREAKHTRIHVLLIFDDNFDPQMPDYDHDIYYSEYKQVLQEIVSP